MDKHPLAGMYVRLQTGYGDPLNGTLYLVEDWWLNLIGIPQPPPIPDPLNLRRNPDRTDAA